jgi:hypothetical protein
MNGGVSAPGNVMIMRTHIRHSWVLAALLVSFWLAGCGAQPEQVVRVAPQPEAVHIQRSISSWLTNGGSTPAPSAVHVTRTDRARVTQFYDHVRSLPTYTVPADAVFHCPVSFGQAVTLISFLAGTTVVLRVKIVENGCVFTSVVGGPQNTYLQTDSTFTHELDDLIANPT